VISVSDVDKVSQIEILLMLDQQIGDVLSVKTLIMLEEHNAIDVKCPGRNDFNERIIKFKKPL
jgi:hypothetical protein